MQILLSDPKILPQPQADRLAEFLISDTCKTLRTVVRSRIADELLLIGENLTTHPEAFLRTGVVGQEVQEAHEKISRLSIFLEVLDGIQSELKSKPNLVITAKLTVDTN